MACLLTTAYALEQMSEEVEVHMRFMEEMISIGT